MLASCIHTSLLQLLQDSQRLCNSGNIRQFTVHATTYVYDWTADTFVPLPNMPDDLPLQVSNARKALMLIDQGKF